jgi:hypothetical protein
MHQEQPCEQQVQCDHQCELQDHYKREGKKEKSLIRKKENNKYYYIDEDNDCFFDVN